MVRRDGDRVRLFTRNGHDSAARYPVIAAAAAALQARSFLLDGEAVVADAQGVASFDLLRGRARATQAFMWAFDLLALDGADLRHLPLERRKGELKALLKRASFGLALNDYVADDGPALFAEACTMALEGIVSKRRASPYRSGPLAAFAQGEEPGEPGGATRGVRGLGRKEAVVSESHPSQVEPQLAEQNKTLALPPL